MRLLVTGNKGYIGTVMVPMLLAAGHEVVGLDSDLFEECTFGPDVQTVPELRVDLRDVQRSRTSRVSTRSSTWPRCPTIRWAT